MNKMEMSHDQILAIELSDALYNQLIRELEQHLPHCRVFCCRNVPSAIAELRILDFYDLIVLGTEPSDTAQSVVDKLKGLIRTSRNTKIVLFTDHDLGEQKLKVDATAPKPSIAELAMAIRGLLPYHQVDEP